MGVGLLAPGSLSPRLYGDLEPGLPLSASPSSSAEWDLGWLEGSHRSPVPAP